MILPGGNVIKLAQQDTEIASCFKAMNNLRTELIEKDFVPLVRELMRGGYQLAYLQVEDLVVCVAGFRVQQNLVLDKHLYVDDLSTLEGWQSKGYGTQMMDWLRQYAIAQQCKVFHLDSGVQRYRAHKFYFMQNMSIVSYHFAEKLS
jgi:GNAT superfamily N-acetyltransferase